MFDKDFEIKFIDWAYKTKGYRYNTIPASLSVLKVWLNRAHEKGMISSEFYKKYTSKGKDVDNIYLNDDEIMRIYELDIPKLKEQEIEQKTETENNSDSGSDSIGQD